MQSMLMRALSALGCVICFMPASLFAQSSAQSLLNPISSALHPAPATQPDLDQKPVDDPLMACACGCGIFAVGTSSMIPQGRGGTIFFEYDYQDQNRNWHGAHSAPAADNDDKEIRTSFLTMGLQYMFNRQWGIQIEVPYAFRHFQTTGGATGNDIVNVNWGALGDIKVEGIYTGFSQDLSAGINFGVKLPTGSFNHEDGFDDVDRDSEIGTGSTDIVLGGFYLHDIDANGKWVAFAQLNMDLPVLIQDQYRPGYEFDQAVGVYYTPLSIGRLGIEPLAQVLASERTTDTGAEASFPIESGYTRILLSPGIELHYHPFMLYGDVEFPIYQQMTGNQLVAPVLFKVILSYRF